MYRREFIEEILSMYLNGASVWEIAEYMNIGDNEVNEIIDKFSPYLG